MAATTSAAEARTTLKDDAKALNLVEFWEQRADVELRQPRNRAKPSPVALRRMLEPPASRRVKNGTDQEECERRALVFANPGWTANRTSPIRCSPPIHSITQVSARRFTGTRRPQAAVAEGDGGFTVVEGEKLRTPWRSDPDADRNVARSRQRRRAGRHLGRCAQRAACRKSQRYQLRVQLHRSATRNRTRARRSPNAAIDPRAG